MTTSLPLRSRGLLCRSGFLLCHAGNLAQMSAPWVDKADNPAMSELGLHSSDVYGAIVAINFTDLIWRVALTPNSDLHPSLEQSNSWISTGSRLDHAT